MKSTEREFAIHLRRQGLSYREILGKVSVAKSTLSLWLQQVKLAKKQHQRLTQKRIDAALRGAQTRHLQKEETVRRIKSLSRAEVGKLSKREKWLIGAALYWGEGTKEKDYAPGSSLIFNNSDPVMTKFYIQWLESICDVPRNQIHLSLYIHETKQHDIERIKDFWMRYLDYPKDSLAAVYYKRNKIRTVRKNTGGLYYGTMRVKVAMSSALHRKVAGWIEGIADSIK